MRKSQIIRHALMDFDMGAIGVAVSEAGICFLGFFDTLKKFEQTLKAEFPRRLIKRDDDGLSLPGGAIVDQIGFPSTTNPLPIAAEGTPFQHDVWKQLRAIPRGQTRTYQQIALALGRPLAVRAVARACATNPVSLLVPCHRVIRRDGSLAGYRWGLARKRELLRREGVRFNPESTSLFGPAQAESIDWR
jgi:AraC family transcriptional regulator of adaptative response/methylated-DNA-[protein]-cysteine methyltransferase